MLVNHLFLKNRYLRQNSDNHAESYSDMYTNKSAIPRNKVKSFHLGSVELRI